MSSPLLQVFGVATRSVATVCACASVGAYARKTGVLDAKGQKVLDKLVASVFLPSLILGSVTPRMTLVELQLIWPMGIMCVCVVLYGLGAGELFAKVLARWHPTSVPQYKGLIMVAVAFPNSFSVPMTLALALGDHPVLLEDGLAGGEELTRKITMLFVMSYAIWVLARWSIGFPILSGAISFKEWTSKVMNPPVKATIFAAVLGTVYTKMPTALQTEDVTQCMQPLFVAVEYAGRCSVPLILFSLGARLHEATMEILGAMKQFGHQAKEHLLQVQAQNNDATLEPMPASVYFSVVLLRQVIGPAFGGFIACWLLRDLCNVHDRAVLLVSMLQSAGPPMINLSVMAGLSGSAEIETAKLLLLSYSASIFTWTASIAVYLRLLG